MLSFATAVIFASLAFNLALGAAVDMPSYMSRHRARSVTMPGLKLVNGDVKHGSYIVKIADNCADRTKHLAWANSLVAGSTVSTASEVRAYDSWFYNAYSAELDDDAVAKLIASEDVAWVEEDGIMRKSAIQTNATWGLQRMNSARALARGSNPRRLNFQYDFDENGGQGVDVYVIDTGVRETHEEFEGRAKMAFTLPGLADTDDEGHGSHVSGTVAGKTFGVAKKANILGVKVLDNQGAGTNSDIIQGINFAVSAARKSGRPSIISMSLGGAGSQAVDAVTVNAVRQGLFVIVAAGNEAHDALQDSPARARGTITVGAMNIQDQVADFSNFGRAVDIFAPGQDIISCGIDSDEDIRSLDGTSMATPHISGLVAVLLSQDPTLTPADMVQKIQGLAIQGVLGSVPSQTVNLVAQLDPSAVVPADFPAMNFVGMPKTSASSTTTPGSASPSFWVFVLGLCVLVGFF